MQEVLVRTYLNVSWTCPECGYHTSHAILGDSKPEKVQCVGCKKEFKAR
jgi:hypothetical protein